MKRYAFALFGLLSAAAGAELPANGTWIEIGPEIGPISSVAVDTLDPSHVVIGSATRGVFVSTNAGLSWQRGERVPFNGKSRALAADPHVAGRFYALSSFTGQLLRSTDGGLTFSNVPGTFEGGSSAVAMDPVNPGVIYIGTTSKGLMRSDDGGASWDRIDGNTGTFTNVRIASIAVDPMDPSLVYVSTQSQLPGVVLAEIDGGDWRFSSVNDGLSSPTNASLTFGGDGKLYAGSSGGAFVFNATDSSWSSLAHPGGSLQVLTADPTTGGVLISGGPSGIHRTSSGGGAGNWTQEAPDTVGLVADLAFATAPIAVSPQTGVLSRSGAGNWLSSNGGLNAGEITTLYVDPQTSGRYLAGIDGLALVETTDGGQTWQGAAGDFADDAPVRHLTPSPFVANRVLAAQGDVYLSDDRGQSWRNLDPMNLVSDDIRGMVVIDTNTVLVATGGAGVMRGDFSNLDAVAWSSENTGLDNLLLNGIAHDPSTGEVLVGTFGDGVFRSASGAGGINWSRVADNGGSRVFVLHLSLDADAGYAYFVASGGAIFRLDLQAPGNSFERLSENLDATSNVRLFAPSGTNRLVAGTDAQGMFYSDDHGESWLPLGNLFPFPLNALLEDPHQPGHYLAATAGASVARLRELTETVFGNGFE